ncbi:phage tail tape measure protein [Evansella halocellulosilytica]|uniref:phage tail tape measure protein n=1 Tax=Evansella halocellulosilytica TaxID=2011013 RepID=UPI000BB9A779|nr:phage tail tape measure protein [Evansella halocellulosilytica]
MNTPNAGEIRARLTLEMDNFTKSMNEAKRHTEEAKKKTQSYTKSIKQVEKGALLMSGAVAGAIMTSVRAAANFEESLSRVASVTGASTEELEKLEATARELAASTAFSAPEVSENFLKLGMAGFDVNEILAATPSILNAATASATDLGTTADIVSNVLSGFNMSAEETDRAVDVLVSTISSANTDLPQLGQALSYIGPVAASLGYDIEEAAAAVGVLSDNGLAGSRAGTTLRQTMLSLASPTSEAATEMEKYGINLLDANDEMLPMPEIVGNIADAMDGMTDAQKTQVAQTLVGTQAASGFLTLISQGEDALADYTGQLRDSEGAASDMAAIQQDNLNGSFREFQSAMGELGIAIGQEYLPAVRRMIERATELTRWFGELNPATVTLGLNFVGASAGIALAVTAALRLATALRGLMMLHPAGWLVLGLSLVGGGIFALTQHMRDGHEVNTEYAEGLLDQAQSLEEVTARYDELRRQSGLTTDQIGDLLDIQKRMESESDPEELAKLEKAYEDIAEKSGLSRDEISELLEANDAIIDQTPYVEQTFTDRGNAVVESTDAVNDYIQSLRNMAWEELQIERIKALENEATLLRDNQKIREDIEQVEIRLAEIQDAYNMSEEERKDRVQEILALTADQNTSAEERLELERELGALDIVKRGASAQYLEDLQEQRKELAQQLEDNEAKLGQLEEVDDALAGILLLELGINETGKEGLEIADEKLEKLRDEKAEVEEQIAKEGDKHGILQMHVDELNEQIGRHESIIGQIEEETRLSSEVLSIEDDRNRKIDQMNDRLADQEQTQQDINREAGRINETIADGVTGAQTMNDELSQSIDKHVNVTDNGTIDEINRRASNPVTKVINFREQMSNAVRSHLTRHNGGLVGQYRPGDGPAGTLHGGGMPSHFLDRMPMFNEVDVRLLRNEMVLTEGQQANLFRALQGSGQVQQVDSGNGGYSSEMLAVLRSIDRGIAGGKAVSVVMDGEKVGQMTEPYVSREQHDRHGLQKIFNGDWGR